MKNTDKQFTEEIQIPRKHMKYGSEYAVTSPVTVIYKLKWGAISCLSPWQETNYWECLYEPWVLQGLGDIAN